MHPFEKTSPGLPPGVSTHLDIRLKSGWRFDASRRVLISPAGEKIGLRELLPDGIRVVPVMPSLAAARPETLSEDEQLLARCLQVVLPARADPANVADLLRSLEGIERVDTPPAIGLA
jgi:hypothetical protein